MRPEIQPFHSLTLETFQSLMYEQLIFKHNITTETAAQWVLEDKDGFEELPEKGYFATKNVDDKKTKYFLPEYMYEQLPIKVNSFEEHLFKDSTKKKSVIFYPTDITPFRITAQNMWNSNKEFIDSLAPFEHSRPEMWTLSKIVAIMGLVGKTFTGICSTSEFGKSSIYLMLDSITKKCPVFQPRSVPGVLAQITGDGNMVFDESQEVESAVKKIMENFSLQVGGNSPIYINGAQKATNTKPRYDVTNQSITFLYNVYSNYKKPDEQFFDYIWSNKKAMDSRFLKLKFEGMLLEKFDKNFDIVAVAEANKMFYMRIAKHLLYLKQLKQSNGYIRRYDYHKTNLEINGRHQIIYDEITWGLDLYCNSLKEYKDYVHLLDSCIISYKEMLGEKVNRVHINPTKEQQVIETVTEEVIEEVRDEPSRLILFIQKNPGVSYDSLEKEGFKDLDNMLKNMQLAGDIYQNKPDCFTVLE